MPGQIKNNRAVIILVLHFFVANGTETIAIPQGDGSTYRLFGYKWFSSATDADVTLTLARVQNPDGTTQPVSTASALPVSLCYNAVSQLSSHLPKSQKWFP